MLKFVFFCYFAFEKNHFSCEIEVSVCLVIMKFSCFFLLFIKLKIFFLFVCLFRVQMFLLLTPTKGREERTKHLIARRQNTYG